MRSSKKKTIISALVYLAEEQKDLLDVAAGREKICLATIETLSGTIAQLRRQLDEEAASKLGVIDELRQARQENQEKPNVVSEVVAPPTAVRKAGRPSRLEVSSLADLLALPAKPSAYLRIRGGLTAAYLYTLKGHSQLQRSEAAILSRLPQARGPITRVELCHSGRVLAWWAYSPKDGSKSA